MASFDFALYPFDAQRVSIEIDEERHNVSTCGTRTFFDADDVPSTFLDATSQWSLEGAPHSRRDPATGACTIELTVRKQQVAPSWWFYPLPSPPPGLMVVLPLLRCGASGSASSSRASRRRS